MEHLSVEALARLVDEPPTGAEEAHLRGCAPCRTELAAFRGQTAALGQLPDLRPPEGDWEVLQARMVSEGLVRGGSGIGRRGLAVTPTWMKAAAAVLLFLGGGAAGFGAAARAGDDGPARAAGLTPVPAGMGGAGLAASTATSVAEAADRVRLAERQYIDALIQYRQHMEAESGGAVVADPAGRFAAVEYLVRASQAAVRQAPADPFLNGILANAIAERQATLRRISTSGEDGWY